MKYVLILIIVLTVFGSTGELWAQNVTVVNNLLYGNILPGIPKTIDKTSAGSAAEYYISGIAGNEISVEFSLPTYMSVSGNNMQLVFSETGCSIDTTAVPDQSSPTFDDLDPWHPLIYRLGSNGMTIWLGGMVIPGLIQYAGDYSAVIVITVTYTGN
ncbi:MAG: hypothetical protein KAR42_02540 [candidate division Zixibacteria bacterium]|nr:hypothetical protein [candidate division Zixibacteria bacterium]